MTALPTFQLYPETIGLDINECLLLMSEPVKEQDVCVSVQVMGEPAVRVEVTMKDQRTFVIPIPDEHLQSEVVMVYIQYKETMIGCGRLQVAKACDQLARLLEKALDPVQMMMSALGLRTGSDADMSALDHDLANVVAKKIPAKDLAALFKGYDGEITPTSGNLPQANRFPTALHFSTYYGFTQLTETLLYCHGSKAALMVVNDEGNTPQDIANTRGNPKIIGAFQRKAIEHDDIYESLPDMFEGADQPVPAACTNAQGTYMDMSQVNRSDTSRWSVVGRTTTGPRLPTNPPPARPRTNSSGTLQSIKEVEPPDLRDSGVFDGNRDSTVSTDSHPPDENYSPHKPHDSADGPEAGKGSKLKRSQPVTTIRRGNVLSDAHDGYPVAVAHCQTKRPSLPNIHMAYAPRLPGETAPPPCTGAIYQNTQGKVAPPVSQRKMSLPGGVAGMAAELQASAMFQKKKSSVPS